MPQMAVVGCCACCLSMHALLVVCLFACRVMILGMWRCNWLF